MDELWEHATQYRGPGWAINVARELELLAEVFDERASVSRSMRDWVRAGAWKQAAKDVRGYASSLPASAVIQAGEAETE